LLTPKCKQALTHEGEPQPTAPAPSSTGNTTDALVAPPGDPDTTTLAEEESTTAPTRGSAVDSHPQEGSTIQHRGNTASTHRPGSEIGTSNPHASHSIGEGSNSARNPTSECLGDGATATSSETLNATSRVNQDAATDPISHAEVIPRTPTLDLTEINARLLRAAPGPNPNLLGFNMARSSHILHNARTYTP
jgi:hypothetical protein